MKVAGPSAKGVISRKKQIKCMWLSKKNMNSLDAGREQPYYMRALPAALIRLDRRSLFMATFATKDAIEKCPIYEFSRSESLRTNFNERFLIGDCFGFPS